MKVLMVGSDPNGQGGMSSVAGLILRYGTEFADIRYVCTYSDGSAAVRIRTWLAGWLRAAWLLVSDRPDVLHAHVSERSSVLRKGVLLALARLLRVPTVLHHHGAFFFDWFAALPGPAKTAVRAVFRLADATAVLSEYWRERHVATFGVDPHTVHVLGNPVEVPSSVPTRGGGPVGVLFLGRFDATKGAVDVLRAVAKVQAQHEVRLTMAGAGDVAALRRLADELGVRAQIRGYLGPAERDQALAGHDILALPSRAEVLPMVVLEAMGYGLVPVVSRVGALPDILVDRRDVLFVPAGDVDAIAAAMQELVADPALRARLARAARESVGPFEVHRYLRGLVAMWEAL